MYENIQIALCSHSQRLLEENNDEFYKYIERELKITPGEFISMPFDDKKKKIRKDYDEIMEIRYGVKCIFLGPEDFYSYPYCKECLLEFIERLEND